MFEHTQRDQAEVQDKGQDTLLCSTFKYNILLWFNEYFILNIFGFSLISRFKTRLVSSLKKNPFNFTVTKPTRATEDGH